MANEEITEQTCSLLVDNVLVDNYDYDFRCIKRLYMYKWLKTFYLVDDYVLHDETDMDW